jgi:hypothetical protein
MVYRLVCCIIRYLHRWHSVLPARQAAPRAHAHAGKASEGENMDVVFRMLAAASVFFGIDQGAFHHQYEIAILSVLVGIYFQMIAREMRVYR